MILIEDLVLLLFIVFVFILFIKYCLPVLKEEVKQAKVRTKKLDLEIEKLNKEIYVLDLIQDLLLFKDFSDLEDFEDNE